MVAPTTEPFCPWKNWRAKSNCAPSPHPITPPPTPPDQVFNALNTLELKSLEEPRYLLEQFAAHPLACLTLASFVATNTGDCARRWIKVRAWVWDRVGAGR